jgi:AcrR family transcriptional regulator
MVEETRAKLIRATRLAFETKGYAVASMDELTAAAGLTRGLSIIISATRRDFSRP